MSNDNIEERAQQVVQEVMLSVVPGTFSVQAAFRSASRHVVAALKAEGLLKEGE